LSAGLFLLNRLARFRIDQLLFHAPYRSVGSIDFPYVLVRFRCDLCKRAWAYRLARLAVKYGSEILLDDLILRLSAIRRCFKIIGTPPNFPPHYNAAPVQDLPVVRLHPGNGDRVLGSAGD
jgi:hypothetical protein